jgi:hypothetical protein
MTATNVDFINARQAVDAIREAAWTQYDYDKATCGHPGCTDHGAERKRIHTRSERGFGADWDLNVAEGFVLAAKRCGWGGDMFGHELGVVGPDDRIIFFEVKRPTGDAE